MDEKAAKYKFFEKRYEKDRKEKLEKIKENLQILNNLKLDYSLDEGKGNQFRYSDKMKRLVYANDTLEERLWSLRNGLLEEWTRFTKFDDLITCIIDARRDEFYKSFFYEESMFFPEQRITQTGYSCFHRIKMDKHNSQVWLFPTEWVYSGELITYVDIYIAMYDKTNRHSFEEVDLLIQKVKDRAHYEQPIMYGLVGLKPENTTNVLISEEEGIRKAKEYNAHFIEIDTILDLTFWLKDLISLLRGTQSS